MTVRSRRGASGRRAAGRLALSCLAPLCLALAACSSEPPSYAVAQQRKHVLSEREVVHIARALFKAIPSIEAFTTLSFDGWRYNLHCGGNVATLDALTDLELYAAETLDYDVADLSRRRAAATEAASRTLDHGDFCRIAGKQISYEDSIGYSFFTVLRETTRLQRRNPYFLAPQKSRSAGPQS